MMKADNLNKPMAIVTAGRKSRPAAIKLAKDTAAKLHLPYVERGRESCEILCRRYQVHFILVVKDGRLVLYTPQGELFFHPGMAHTRIKNLALGQKDHLIEAMNLKPGMSVLDCTLGLAADALVTADVVGEKGLVTALEANPLIAAVIGYGLANDLGENYRMQQAMRLIDVINIEHGRFLRTLPDNAYDVVYFDPMFRHPLLNSSGLSPLRTLADNSAIDVASVIEARRVAKHRVVLKESSLSTEFSRLGFTQIVGGRYSRIKYGIIEIQ